MTTIQLLPAIDLRAGRVVRLTQGDDARRTDYDVAPRAMLERFGAAGVTLVHVVDLDAAFGEPPQTALVGELARAAARDGLPQIEIGGGLRDRDGVARVLDLGCARAVMGSIVARDAAAFAAIADAFPGRVVPALEVAAGDAQDDATQLARPLRIAGWREDAAVDAGTVARRLRDLPCPAVLVTRRRWRSRTMTCAQWIWPPNRRSPLRRRCTPSSIGRKSLSETATSVASPAPPGTADRAGAGRR
ncbi:MAG: HisA/HisF-related TIM barrel protein, partial [Acidobacteriota bacterium]